MLGRQPKGVEKHIDDEILGVIESHRSGIGFKDLRKEVADKIRISKADKTKICRATLFNHLDDLRRLGVVIQPPPGKLYFLSRVWAQKDPETGYISKSLRPEGNLYISLLLCLTSLTHRYLALLQAAQDAPNLAAAHQRAEFFLRDAGESEMMGLVRRVYDSKVPLDSLIGKKLFLEFVKGPPPDGGVSVRGRSPGRLSQDRPSRKESSSSRASSPYFS